MKFVLMIYNKELIRSGKVIFIIFKPLKEFLSDKL